MLHKTHVITGRRALLPRIERVWCIADERGRLSILPATIVRIRFWKENRSCSIIRALVVSSSVSPVASPPSRASALPAAAARPLLPVPPVAPPRAPASPAPSTAVAPRRSSRSLRPWLAISRMPTPMWSSPSPAAARATASPASWTAPSRSAVPTCSPRRRSMTSPSSRASLTTRCASWAWARS